MVRYAEWREAVDPERPLARYDGLVRFGAAVAGAVLGGYCCCFLGAIPGYVLAERAAAKNLALKRLARMRDDPTMFAQHPCHLELSCDGRAYGWDEGLVSFVDGTMLFEGRRTSFSMGPQDKRLVPAGFVFRFPSPIGYCEAKIVPLYAKEMRVEYEAWWLGKNEETIAVVYPPHWAQRAAWRRAERARFAAWAAFVIGTSICMAGYVMDAWAAFSLGVAIWVAASMTALWSKTNLKILRTLEGSE